MGLCMAEGLVEAGGMVYCLDRTVEPPEAYKEAKARVKDQSSGGLEYHHVDVTHSEAIEKCMAGIASEKQRLDGLIAGK